MNIVGIGKRVRVYIGEGDLWHGKPLFLSILETLRAEGCAGATATRGIAGFGAHSRMHTATILRLSEELPIVVEWVDAPERIERVLPRITAMVVEGLITVEDVEIVHYQHRVVEDIWNRLPVREVMTRDVVTVRPDTPLREAVALLVEHGLRVLPVIEAGGRVVGIATNGDLIERGGLRLRVEMLRVLTQEALGHELAAVEEGKSAADVMTRDVVTVAPEATLSEAAHLMVTRQIKRLPVVDQSGALLGMISRLDLLQTCSEAYPKPTREAVPQAGKTIGAAMRTDVPVVGRNAPLPEVLDAVISTRLNRAIVVDEERHVLGVVTDAELVRRLSPRDHPGIAQVLVGRLRPTALPEEQRRQIERAAGNTAETLMIPNVPTVPPDMPLIEAISVMLREERKILPVVDADGRLLGAVDRADLLRVLEQYEEEATE